MLVVSILASFVALLDGFAVNVALPAIVRDLGGGLQIQQWVVDGYLLTLGSLILVAGSFSDLFGRRRILKIGLIWFLATSLLCAVAPNGPFLVVARLLQGAGGALLVPSSLALIMSTFSGKGEGKAIGTWTAWISIAALIGPLVGGVLVDAASWRWIFAINVLPVTVTLALITRLHSTEHRAKDVRVDGLGVILCVLGLGGVVYGFIEQATYGWSAPRVFIPLALGVLAFVWFVRNEQRVPNPMLPLSLFASRNFAVGNIATFVVYGGLSLSSFLISVFVQQVAGYSALQAGLTTLPVTVMMFFLSSRVGALGTKYGPRAFMAVGPIVAGLGGLWFLTVDNRAVYVTQLLPGILLFGIGLATTVTPLTTAILGAIDPARAGIASAVNNAVARIAGLVAVAVLGLVVGDHLNVSGFHKGAIFMASLLIVGGLISAVGIQNHVAKSEH